MLLYLLVFIQLLATMFLAVVVRHASRLFKVPLTIHNLPIVLMSVLLLAVALWLSITYTHVYFMVGTVGAIIMLAAADYSQGKISTVLISLSSILLWAQLGTFMAFCLSNQDKLET